MKSQLTIIDLKEALRQDGCPICRLQRKAEKRYLRNLLWEYVNDLSARSRFLASWGYCAGHARLLGQIELKEFGDAMGTAIMFESLAQQLESRLREVRGESTGNQARPWLGIFGARWTRSKRSPYNLAPAADCYVCEIGGGSAAYALEVLIGTLEDQEIEILHPYQSSDGLCLPHLRSALAQSYPEQTRASRILIDHVQKRVIALQAHLAEYIRKHGWDARFDWITPEEYASWSKAIAFFSGGLIEEIPRETIEGE